MNTVNLFFSGSQQLLISLIEIKNLTKNLLSPIANNYLKIQEPSLSYLRRS